MNIQVQEAQQILCRINPKSPPSNYIVIKLSTKTKKESGEHLKKRDSSCRREAPIRQSVNFLAETLQARRQQDDIFKGCKKETC